MWRQTAQRQLLLQLGGDAACAQSPAAVAAASADIRGGVVLNEEPRWVPKVRYGQVVVALDRGKLCKVSKAT